MRRIRPADNQRPASLTTSIVAHMPAMATINATHATQEGSQVALVQKFCEQGDLLRMLHRCGGRMNERAAVQVGGCSGASTSAR